MNGADKRPIAALLSASGIEYFIHTLALLRLGWTVMYLSPNNSAEGIAHLLRATKCQVLFVQDTNAGRPRQRLGRLAGKAKELVSAEEEAEGFSELRLESIVGEEIWEGQERKSEGGEDEVVESYPSRFKPEVEAGHVAFIIHSSGSTGFPKPIFITHAASVHNFENNVEMKGLCTLPLYHAHGHSSLFRALHSLKSICLYPPELPITAANVIRVLRDFDPEVLYAVPFVLKLLAESSDGVEALAKLKLVMFGGSSCPDGLGDELTRKGVRLLSHYGMTEVGQLMTSERDFEMDRGWDWVRASEFVRAYLRFEEHSPGVFELVVLNGWRSKVMSNRPDSSYASKDLFVKHPNTSHAYKFVGRLDDTITLVNGEKTNPIRYENALKESPGICDAVVFGNGRAECGVLVLPTKPVGEIHEGIKTEEAVMGFINSEVEPWLKKANAEAESHAQITVDMVCLLKYDTLMPRADKGTVLRPAVYREFSGEIERMYQRDSLNVSKEKTMFGLPELTVFLRQLVQEALGREVAAVLRDESDLFGLGLDSLKAMKVKDSIASQVDVGERSVSMNLVYECGTIEKLARYLIDLREGNAAKQDECAKMLRMVEIFSDFERHSNKITERNTTQDLVSGEAGIVNIDSTSIHQSKPTTILITGASGSLGAHLLGSILCDPTVSQVYCLVRAKTDIGARYKVHRSLQLRRLDRHVSDPRIVCLGASLAEPHLGLCLDVYASIAERVTAVVHDGWAVNFALGVDSFEADCIRGLRNLIQLCLDGEVNSAGSEPALAAFFFVSSISSTAGPAAPRVVLEQHYSGNPYVAQETGYARSKWVGEQIVRRAIEIVPNFQSSVFRLGQLVGDRKHGVWNTTEAISLMIKSGDVMGILPDLDGERLCWLPVDAAAEFCVHTVLDPRHGCKNVVQGKVWNVVCPETVAWLDCLEWLKDAGMKFKTIATSAWIQALEESAQAHGLEKNPAVKLIGFWKKKYGQRDRDGTSRIENVNAAAGAGPRKWKTQVKASAVDRALIERFVEAWRSEGFLQRKS